MNGIGNEGIADWLNGITPSQIKKQCNRLIEITKRILPNYPNIKLGVTLYAKENIKYDILTKPGNERFMVAVFSLRNTNDKITEESAKLYNEFTNFLNELAEKFNKGKYKLACLESGLSRVCGICTWNGHGTHKYVYKPSSKLDPHVYKSRMAKVNTVLKLINMVISKYPELKSYTGRITKDSEYYDESSTNYLLGKDHEIAIYYYDFHKAESKGEETYNLVENKLKSFLNECNKGMSSITVLQDSSLVVIDDRIYLKSTKLTTANEFFGLFSKYKKEEVEKDLTILSNEVEKISKKYNLEKHLKKDFPSKHSIDSFIESKDNEYHTLVFGNFFSMKENFNNSKEVLIKVLKEIATKIPNKYSFICKANIQPEYISIYTCITKQGYKFDLEKFITSLEFKNISKDDKNKRKAFITKINTIIKTILSNKYKEISKGFTFKDEDGIKRFVNGYSNTYHVGWDIWRVTKNARDDEEYEKINDILMNALKDIEIEVKKINVSMEFDGDWDTAYIAFTPKSLANESLYTLALSQFNYINNYNFEYGSEGLYQALARFVRGILNTLFKILNNFKALVTRGFKDLKRTELEEYIDSNKFSIDRIVNFNYTNLINLEVDIPLGMTKPYKVTLEKINSCLESLSMIDRTNGMLNSVNSILTSLLSNTNTVITKNTINTGELRSLEHLYKEQHNCFSAGNRKDREIFTKVFESDHCLTDTYNLLKKTTRHEYDVSKVYHNLEQLYSKFEQILKLIDNNETSLTKEDILHLSGCTVTLAKLFDMYGLVIHDLQKVEHNFVLVLKTIQKNFDL